MKAAALLLGMDTCGPLGSVALTRLDGDRLELLEQVELAGRSYSATLVRTVREILGRHSVRLADLSALVVVAGPGSFTGVRVGLSVAKGLAEPTATPILAVSRLAVLAAKAGTNAAALDAHRSELFLRLPGSLGEPSRELLVCEAELENYCAPEKIAVCDAAANMIRAGWPGTLQEVTSAPTASDAVQAAIPRLAMRDFDDSTTLDGHYLRRSDAEIFGSSLPVARGESREGQ